jgi:hypothetical protein
MVLFALCAIRMSVFLNNLVMVLVWLPTYVNVAHFCCCVVLDILFVFGLCINAWGRYPLLCSIIFISCVSLCLLFVDIGYLFNLFVTYLMAACLCSVGWHELL